MHFFTALLVFDIAHAQLQLGRFAFGAGRCTWQIQGFGLTKIQNLEIGGRVIEAEDFNQNIGACATGQGVLQFAALTQGGWGDIELKLKSGGRERVALSLCIAQEQVVVCGDGNVDIEAAHRAGLVAVKKIGGEAGHAQGEDAVALAVEGHCARWGTDEALKIDQ